MKKLLQRLCALCAVCAVCATTEAKIVLPEIVGDNMVLQQQTDARLWGKAAPKSTITVTVSWTGDKFTTRADRDGQWLLSVRTPAASYDEHTVVIEETDGKKPADKVVLSRVLIGEVWFASGQSNMEMPLNGFWNCPVEGSNEVIATAAEHRYVRMAPIPQNGKTEIVEEVPGKWQVASAETAPWFSATGWFFATMLQRALQVPVGVIACAWGGSRVEGWLPESIVSQYSDVDVKKEQEKGWNGQWWHYHTPCIMYNGMLHPLRHYSVRGFLWYQGESNVGKHDTYPQRLKTMVDLWRSEFGGTAEQMPFFEVEIAPWGGNDDWSGPRFRDCQHEAARLIENAGCICTNDLVYPHERGQIHPAQKREVGYRLAYMALNRTYGFKTIACDAPEFDHMQVNGSEIEVFFRYADDGLSPWQDIVGFEIAGADGVFHTATARLNESNKSILVSSPDVPQPKDVRYGYRAFLSGNLKNHRGLPVVPFSTEKK